MVSRYIINTGKINSADESPNQLVLKALPLDLLKYLEIVVVAVWDIIPWPENLMRNIAKKRIVTEEILEKKKQEKESNRVTKKANLNTSMSSIFFPNQIKKKLLNNVADAYIEPNCPWVMDNSFLILELNNPKKKLCPKLEKNVNMNPKIITFKLKLLNII